MTAHEMHTRPSATGLHLALKEWRKGWQVRNVPMATWLAKYNRDDLPGDTIAGAVVAITLIPQAMAYSTLAGLPPQMGLYTSLLPPIMYSILGSSRTMGVGPVAI
jgi:SulP family sulfate permease